MPNVHRVQKYTTYEQAHEILIATLIAAGGERFITLMESRIQGIAYSPLMAGMVMPVLVISESI